NEVVTLKHEAENKGIFSEGAVSAAKFLVNAKPGLYSMADVLDK
ncbi:MAG TPA: 4-hydroxy-tetrahydrodipicolinate reductase, partial [Candidatus Stercoripulliclostridium merdigallinarum]|nr:4-hydroxy-tetrahydrodipicolinate reductase [Candidatus Stercoripulliclostridium merdigallinarum]